MAPFWEVGGDLTLKTRVGLSLHKYGGISFLPNRNKSEKFVEAFLFTWLKIGIEGFLQ